MKHVKIRVRFSNKEEVFAPVELRYIDGKPFAILEKPGVGTIKYPLEEQSLSDVTVTNGQLWVYNQIIDDPFETHQYPIS